VSKTRIAAGVDAGSSRTRCVICELDAEGCLRLLGFGEAPARGWTKSRITDQNAAAESIREAISAAERSADPPLELERTVLGVGGSSIRCFNSRGIYEFARPREIEPADMRYAAERASHIHLEDDRYLLQVVPQDFTLDGRAGYRNPGGIFCSRLEANVHVITTSHQDHQCVVAAVHKASLAVEETIFEPMAAAYAAILPVDRTGGVALLDIGAHSTDVVVYHGDALLLAMSLPLGGAHFTHDVSWGLCISEEDAERLKVEYGCAILGLTADNTLIEVPSPEDRPPREATRRQLNEILEARADELFDYVRAEVARIGMERNLREGVVLTGGGAMLPGMCDMAERVLNCPARNGLGLGIMNWPHEIDNPAWTTAAGLAMYSARLKMHRDTRRKAPGLLGLLR
jgi:cell division protein FtsA